MKKVITKLKKSKIIDILQTGIAQVCFNEIKLIQNFNLIYIETENTYIKIESIAQNSKLMISYADMISHGSVPEEEDLPPYQHSIANIVLNDSDFNNIIDSIILFGEEKNDLESIICHSMQLLLDNGQQIFFDPSFHWGINIGGKSQKEMWLDNIVDQTQIIGKTY